MRKITSRGRLFPKGEGRDDAAPRMDNNIMTDTPTGPMTRSRAKAIQDKVNSLLSHHQFDPLMNGLLPQANVLCILRFEANINYGSVPVVVVVVVVAAPKQ